MEKIKLFILFISFFLLLPFQTFCKDSSKIEKFALKVIELVIKRDVESIYKLGTDGFKSSLTIAKLESMFNTVFSLYKGEPKGGEFVKMRYYPKINATEMWFKLNFNDKKWLFIGCIIQETNKKFYLYALRLKVPSEFTPQVSSIPYVDSPAIDFAKKALTMVSIGKLRDVMSLVHPEVKRTTGEDNIILFLKTLKGIKLKKVSFFNQNFLKYGIIYNIKFDALLKDSHIVVEIKLKKEKGNRYKILDINAYK